MGLHPEQDVDQVGGQVHAVGCAGGDEGVEAGQDLGGGAVPHEEIARCADAIPLHPQAKAFQRVGMPMSDSTLGDVFRWPMTPLFACRRMGRHAL